MAITKGDAAHLARRTGFGATPERVAALAGAADRNAAVARAMSQANAPTDALSPAISPLLPSLNGAQVDLLQLWWLDRMVCSPTPIVEKMTLFWHGHFATAQDKVADISMLYGQNRTLRRHALGNFHDLAQAVAVDPAMLIYLDNWANVKGTVQENFGRELLEAFTIGPSQRTQTDVMAMTRAWTGHGLDGSRRQYRFDAAQHDTTPSSLFGSPRRVWDGPEALTEVLRGARAEASSRFITAKLFSFLAYPVTPEDPTVERLASGFRASGLSIERLVGDILRSEEFWSTTARKALVRSPMEWVVATLQALGVPPILADAQQTLRRLGHEPFNPPNVFGWRGQRAWLSSSAVWAKGDWAGLVGQRAATLGVLDTLLGDVGGLVNTLLGKPRYPAPSQVAASALDRFGIVDPSAVTRRRVEAWIGANQPLLSSQELAIRLAQLVALTPDHQLA